MAASDMWKGSATSVTAMSSSSSIVRIDRRVGSARAANMASRLGGMGRTLAGRRAIVNRMVEYADRSVLPHRVAANGCAESVHLIFRHIFQTIKRVLGEGFAA
ncbi:hypothetical protein [Paragemmobacter aquarius]|uniref:hypothetical protein n=1 Tax=Paragemmobacter aquarius TaxID=2169400 RepID=UPI001E571548|nr:hypothetical protein [Gemmobacter aquarius]